MIAYARRSIEATGRFMRFAAALTGDIFSGRVFQFFGEAVRQAGLLITSSMLVILGLMFIIGTTCGIESAFFNRSTGSPSYAGVFAAWCNLREAGPYAFGYMMAAKVGTGIVAEIGSMRVNEEVDTLEVMGIDALAYLCATRLLASWVVLPAIYLLGIGSAYAATYLSVIYVVGDTSAGGFNLIFWLFQDPLDIVFSLLKGMTMSTLVVIVGCYFGYTANGGSVGVGAAAAKSMVVNAVGVHVIGMLGTQLFWGINPRAPIGG